MGLGRGSVKFLIREALRKPFQGRILTLGKQDVWIDQCELESIAREFRYPLVATSIDPLCQKAENKEKELISDVYLFARLGFGECKSIDYSNYEGADYVFDLNQPEPPKQLIETFDFILDGGTLEHVFHLPNALRNIFLFAKQGSRIVHISPSSNHMDHGFYMFSPTLFWDFYEVNKFKLNEMKIIKHNPWHDTPWDICRYEPGCINSVSYGGLDDSMYAIYCSVTKTPESTAHIVPQQRNYLVGAWKKKTNSQLNVTFLATIKNRIRRNRFLYKILLPIARLLRPRKGLKLKVLERF